MAMEFVSYDIESKDFRRAGAASGAIKEHLKRIGAEAEAIRRTMIAAYEAEMNVVIHSVGGRLEASFSDTRIDVNVVDEGPGIPDIELAMAEGYSTADAKARALGFGAGMGLPNIMRSSDRLRVTSRAGEGTRVSFSVYLRPEVTCRAPVISLYASTDRCRGCRACLAACPTQALRVRDGRPMVLEHLCIDCGQCIAACTTGALTIRDVLPSLDDITARDEVRLIVPPALPAGFGPDYRPLRVLAALNRLGFACAETIESFEEALRDAALGIPGTARAEMPAGPVILPMCPAVVNLIELKFPSLVGSLAPFLSPWEAAEATGAHTRLACVVSCPGQRSALEVGEAVVECLLPETLRAPVMELLTAPARQVGDALEAGVPRDAMPATPAEPEKCAVRRPLRPEHVSFDSNGILMVSGIRHVMAVLEEIENGLLEDITVVEAYACEGGCFGSPLLLEDHHVARRRWFREIAGAERPTTGGARVVSGGGGPTAGAAHGGVGPSRGPVAQALPLRRPYAARPGIRLDADMQQAIRKLGRLQALIRSLPGRDCGACGAPTCAALAEDVVMERAVIDLCPYTASKTEDS